MPGRPLSDGWRTVGDVNLLDLALVVLLIVAVLGGYRVGFVARVATWLGLAAGVFLSTRTVPLALELLTGGEPQLRLVLGVLVLGATVSLTSALFRAIGGRARRSIDATVLSTVDRGAGALAGGLAVVAVIWFLLPAAAEVPGVVAREVRGSNVVGVIAEVTPQPPDAVRALRVLVDSSRFPEVFAEFQPTPVTGPPPEDIPVDGSIVDRATAATVNVSANGCGRRYEGSGVTIAPGTVVTNAHVVAGASDVTVTRPDGERREAVVVVFDPRRDLAVLEVADLGQTPLALADIDVGADGVSIGYPGGQATPRVAPLRVDDRRTALGRDIYGQAPTEREVLFLSASLQQGDSGSPVVASDGSVGGIVFAISPDQPTTAYALDLTEVEAVLGAPRNAGATGTCITN